MTSVLAFIVTLGILIVVHEYGHYKVARWCGVRVLRFSVGFGKVIWRRQSAPSATEFAVSAVPLGGYVKFQDERDGPLPAGAKLDESFNRKSLSQRTAIVAAGPLANLLLAVTLYAAASMVGLHEPSAVLGTPVRGGLAEQADLRAGDRVLAVKRGTAFDENAWQDVASMSDLQWALSGAVVAGEPLQLRVASVLRGDARADAGAGSRTLRLDLHRLGSKDLDAKTLQRMGLGGVYREPLVGNVAAGEPAQAAGLRSGDRVISVDAVPMVDASMLAQRIRAHADQPMQWLVERDGVRQTLTIRPRAAQVEGQTIGRVGAALGGPARMQTVRKGPWDATVHGVNRVWEVSSMTVITIGRMLIGEASVKNLTGPLTIADVAGRTVDNGVTAFLGFLALVSVSLGVMNLLPLPMLDGGHLMYYLFEALTGRPVSDAWLDRFQRGGAVVLMLVMVVALSNDVLRLMGR
jgi:regulator of sigma E protease